MFLGDQWRRQKICEYVTVGGKLNLNYQRSGGLRTDVAKQKKSCINVYYPTTKNMSGYYQSL